MIDANTVFQQRKLYEQFAKQVNRSEFFKQLLGNNHAYRHVLRFLGNLAMFSALLGVEIALSKISPWLAVAALPFYVYLQACVIFAFMVHSHELSHNHIRSRWLNDTLGMVSGYFIFVNFYSFQHTHQFHHRNIGNLDTPEIGAPVSRIGQERFGHYDVHHALLKLFQASKPLAYLVTWPLHIFYGDYTSWVLPIRVRGRIHQKSLVCFSGLLAINAALISRFGLGYLILYLAPVFLAGVGILMISFLHHAHEDSVFFNEEHHSRNASMMYTTDRDYGRIGNWIMMNNGFHVTHHLNPKIAYYDLKRASEYLRATLPSGLKYNYYKDSDLYRDFVDGLYEQRLDGDYEVYQLKYRSS